MEDKRVVSKTFYKRRDHVKFYTFHSIFRSSSTILIILVLAFMIYNAIRTTNTYALEDGVNNVYPAVQLLAWVMVTDVQVTHQNQLQGASHRFVGSQCQCLAILVAVVKVAIEKQTEYHQTDGSCCPPVLI